MNSTESFLTPNIETADDYKRVFRDFSKTSNDFLDRIKPKKATFTIEEFDSAMGPFNVYSLFQQAFKEGKNLFLTRDEIRTKLLDMAYIPHEVTNKLVYALLYDGILKEVRMEWPLTEALICLFCSKPSGYPIKETKLLLLTEIVAWSCSNERCHMYKKKYGLWD